MKFRSHGKSSDEVQLFTCKFFYFIVDIKKLYVQIPINFW